MPEIANLFVSVTSDVSNAIAGLTQVDQRINGTSAAMQAAAPAGYALAAAAGTVGAAFLSSVGQAADFEHQINGIKAVMSPAEVQQFGGAVEDLALKLGKDTVFSASQAADAIETMIKAGVPLPAILGGAAQSALDLASATGTDVTRAAELASTAMNAFHESADRLPHIMDTIANVSNATATSVEGLQLGLAAVGPVANGLGITFDDTATALGIFANNGLKGSDAGTSLKTMLLNLEPSSKAQVAAFKELGLITEDGSNKFFDATGKARSMSEIFEILKTSTSGLTQEQKINLLQTAFGTDAVRAATIAANEGAAGWDAVTASMDKMGGTQVAAAQRNKGLEGSMNQLGGSFEAVQIQVGSLFLPVLTKLADGLTGLLNGFLSLDDGTKTVIVAIVGIAGAAAGLLAGFILLGPVLGAVGAAFGIIGAAIAPLLLPLAALVAAGVLLYEAWQTNFGGIRDVTAEVWEAMQPAFQNIQDFVSALVNGLGPAFAGVQAAVAPFITALSNDLAPVLARIPDLVRLIGDGFNLLSDPAKAILSIINILATGNYNGGIFGLDENSGVVQFFKSLHDSIALFFDAVLKLLNGDFEGAWNSLWGSITTQLQAVATAVPQLLGTLKDAIGTLLQGLPGFISSGVTNLWGGLKTAFEGIVPQLQPAWTKFADWLAAVAGGIPQWIADKAGDLWGKLKEAFQGVVGQLGPAWNVFADWLAGVAGGIPQWILDKAGDVWGKLREAFEGVVGQLEPAWNVFAQWLADVAGGIPQWVIDKAGDVWGKLREAFEGIVDQLQPAWDVFAEWLARMCGGIPQFVIEKAGDVFGGLVAAFQGLVGALTPEWETFTTWFQKLLEGMPQFVIDHIGDVFKGIVDQAKDLFNNISRAIDPIKDLLAGTFGNVFNWITNGTPTNSGSSGQPASPPTGGGAAGGITVYVSIGSISSEAEKDAFLDDVAAALLAAARRVSPPATGANPVLG